MCLVPPDLEISRRKIRKVELNCKIQAKLKCAFKCQRLKFIIVASRNFFSARSRGRRAEQHRNVLSRNQSPRTTANIRIFSLCTTTSTRPDWRSFYCVYSCTLGFDPLENNELTPASSLPLRVTTNNLESCRPFNPRRRPCREWPQE